MMRIHILLCAIYTLNFILWQGSVYSMCPEACTCTNVTNRLRVKCCTSGHHELKTIPALPKETIIADFSGCRVTNIPPGIFNNVSFLSKLDISGHRLPSIEKNQFSGLQQLKDLNISHGGKTLRQVEDGVFSELFALRILDISFNEALYLSQIPAILQGLNHTRTLKELYLDGINSYKYSIELHLSLKYLQVIEVLDLDALSMINMCIETYDYEILERIVNRARCFSFAENFFVLFQWRYTFEVLHAMIHNNKTLVFHVPNQAHSRPVKADQNSVEYSFQQRCEFISACHDAINRTSFLLDNKSVQTGRTLTERSVKHQDETMNAFSFFPNLQYLNMDRCVRGFGWGNMKILNNQLRVFSAKYTTGLELTGPLKGFDRLEELRFTGSYLIIMDPNSLGFMPALRTLDLSSCHLEAQMEHHNTTLIRNMTSLEQLDLSDNDIPTINLEYLKHEAPNLRTLSLAKNRLSSIPNIVTSGKLQYLDLSGNHFILLNDRDRSELEDIASANNGVVVDILSSSFDCQCSKRTFDFLHWIQTTKVQIKARSNLTCHAPWETSVVEKRLLELHACAFCSFWYQCYRYWIFGIGGFFGALLTALAIVSIVYKYRWFILYTYYTKLKPNRRMQQRRADGESTNSDSESHHSGPGSSEERRPLLNDESGAPSNTSSENVVFVIYIYDEQRSSISQSLEYTFVHTHLEPIIREAGFVPIYNQEQTGRRHPLPGRFQPGRCETADISETISDTWCAFFIVSNALITNDNYEWYIPLANQKSKNYSFLLFMEKIELEELLQPKHKYLNRLIRSGQYAEWSSEESAQNLFKNRVMEHMNAQ